MSNLSSQIPRDQMTSFAPNQTQMGLGSRYQDCVEVVAEEDCVVVEDAGMAWFGENSRSMKTFEGEIVKGGEVALLREKPCSMEKRGGGMVGAGVACCNTSERCSVCIKLAVLTSLALVAVLTVIVLSIVAASFWTNG